jgi:hypothetical protein
VTNPSDARVNGIYTHVIVWQRDRGSGDTVPSPRYASGLETPSRRHLTDRTAYNTSSGVTRHADGLDIGTINVNLNQRKSRGTFRFLITGHQWSFIPSAILSHMTPHARKDSVQGLVGLANGAVY